MAASALQGAEPAVLGQHSYEEFRQGSLGNSASNLYVSRAGRVEAVHPWDLNRDGYPDLVFSADHDMRMWVDALVYWGAADGPESLVPPHRADLPLATLLFREFPERARRVTRLPAFGGGRAAAADLNRDGRPDLIFCNYTDFPERRSARIYWNAADGFSAARFQELPVLRADDVRAGDLNRDGYPDLLFANFGVSPTPGEYGDWPEESWIYWGSPDGFSTERRTGIEVGGTLSADVGDLNRDGWPDLLFVHARGGEGLRVFWGGKDGFSAKRRKDVAVKGPTSVRAADLDGDGAPEVIVTTGAVGSAVLLDQVIQAIDPKANYAYVYRNGAAGPDWEHPLPLPTHGGSGSAVADFNRDGHPDLAFSCAGSGADPRVDSLVYFGGPDGLKAERRVSLPTLGATAVAAADLNGDDYPDLVFSNSNDGKTRDVPSYVYWGSKTGFAPYLRRDLIGFGAAHVLSADLNGDRHPEVVLVNRESGTVGGKVNSVLYWGNPHHHYSPASMTLVPTNGAYGTAACDLDADGYVDLAFADSYGQTSSVHWGGKEGYRREARTELPVATAYGLCVADLDRDGYLDLVYDSTPDWMRANNELTVFWGDGKRFSGGRVTRLPMKTSGSLMCLTADLNRDGWLDLVASDHGYGKNHVFWGGAQGFSPDRVTVRQTVPGQIKLADLDGDGVLDWALSGSIDPKTRSRETVTEVYRGRPDGSIEREPFARLAHYTSDELAIADLNRDGHLDLAVTNVLSNRSRVLPTCIYWGAPGGKFTTERRTEIGGGSFSGIQLIDLDGNGYRELVLHNHLVDGDHSGHSFIYWGGAEGYSDTRRTTLPTIGPQFSRMVDPGNLYTRELTEEYFSPPMEAPAGSAEGAFTAKAETPPGSSIEYQVRSAASASALEAAVWRGPEGKAHYTGQGEAVTLPSGHRWLQYRALFRSERGASWPALSDVTIRMR